MSRLCEQDKVVRALEEKLQQLHKEKVGRLPFLCTVDVAACADDEDTGSQRRETTQGCRPFSVVLFIPTVHARASLAVSQPGNRDECR